MPTNHLILRHFGLVPYQDMLQAMHTFTAERLNSTIDEVWFVEHPPVFTQGQAGKAEHLLATDDIPVVQSDRGGQVTYHGPGQQIIYFLIDLRRKAMGVRDLVTHIETIVIETLAEFGIQSRAKKDAPGVYVGEEKICSLGLRIRKGCSFHGLALNVNMDLSPFLRINPCGYAGMKMTQTSALGGPDNLQTLQPILIQQLTSHLGYDQVESFTEASPL